MDIKQHRILVQQIRESMASGSLNTYLNRRVKVVV